MKKFYFTFFGLLLISLFSFGQAETSVVIFNGRGKRNGPQKILDMSYQELEKFPVVLNPETEILILDNNKLEKLPVWIGELKNLKVLSLRNNSFRELDFGINNCEKLEQLYLSGNSELSDISAISTSSKLKLIDVTDTRINELPAGIQMMDSLLYFKYSRKNEKIPVPDQMN